MFRSSPPRSNPFLHELEPFPALDKRYSEEVRPLPEGFPLKGLLPALPKHGGGHREESLDESSIFAVLPKERLGIFPVESSEDVLSGVVQQLDEEGSQAEREVMDFSKPFPPEGRSPEELSVSDEVLVRLGQNKNAPVAPMMPLGEGEPFAMADQMGVYGEGKPLRQLVAEKMDDIIKEEEKSREGVDIEADADYPSPFADLEPLVLP